MSNNARTNYNKKLWFKSKKFGWGWYPSSIEGWTVTVLFLVLIIFTSFFFAMQPFLLTFFLFLESGILIFICYKTGETPHWSFDTTFLSDFYKWVVKIFDRSKRL